jgi:hypothetical protein
VIVAEKTSTRPRPVTIEDCDQHIVEWWDKFRNDKNADGEECLQKIDWWLDARLLVMREGATALVEKR